MQTFTPFYEQTILLEFEIINNVSFNSPLHYISHNIDSIKGHYIKSK